MAAPLLAALVLAAGCPGSSWQPCKELEIATRDSSNKERTVRYDNARFRVVNADPLTVEWEHTKCVELKSESGASQEVCARESVTEQVDRVTCR